MHKPIEAVGLDKSVYERDCSLCESIILWAVVAGGDSSRKLLVTAHKATFKGINTLKGT